MSSTHRKALVTAGIYARYSSDKQNPDSADDQIARIRYHAKRGNLRLIKYPPEHYKIHILDDWVLKDEEDSGRSRLRTAYKQMLQGIREYAFQVLLVDDLSRLTRSLGDQIHLYDLLHYQEIELFSLCDGMSSESLTAKTHFFMKGFINDIGNEGHALRTRRGMEARILKGFSTGDICYGYGSRPTKTRFTGGHEVPSHYEIFVNTQEAEVVNLIFNLKIAGLGNTAIAKELNTRQIPSSKRNILRTKKRFNWNSSTINGILSQEKYIGIWRWGKTSLARNPMTQTMVQQTQPEKAWIEHFEGKGIREDLVIISTHKWQQVAQMKQRFSEPSEHLQDSFKFARQRLKKGLHNKKLLSGLLRCHSCKGRMFSACGKGDGYYGCYTYYREDKEQCSNNHLLNKVKVEAELIKALKVFFDEPIHMDEVIALLNQQKLQLLEAAPKELRVLKKQQRQLQRDLHKLVNFVMDGDVSISVREALRNKEAELETISQQIKWLEKAKTRKKAIVPSKLKKDYQKLFGIVKSDPLMGNYILKALFPKALACVPAGKVIGNRNQHTNKWMIKGQIMIGDFVNLGLDKNSTAFLDLEFVDFVLLDFEFEV